MSTLVHQPHLLHLLVFHVDPQDEVEFTKFLHHSYLPAVVKSIPEVRYVTRYEHFGVDGSLEWYQRQSFVLYDMVWEPGKPDADEIVPWFGGVFKEARSKDDAFDRICAQFESWMKDGRAKTLHESTFQQTYQYDRILYPGPYFGTRPFFCVMAEVPSDKNQEFSDWYGNKYLPQLLADVPYFTGACT